MKRPTCQACLDNPNIPAGNEKQAEHQMYSFWLCDGCRGYIVAKPNGATRLRRLGTAGERLSLVGLLE